MKMLRPLTVSLALASFVIPALAREIRFMSYNILHGRGADKVVDISRAADAIKKERPDYVGLQEVDRGVSRSGGIDEPAELARLAGIEHHTFASAFPYKGGEYGRAMLSREKPLAVDKIRLDGKNPGVLLLCEFKGFWFGTMHLDLNENIRLKQVEIVRKAVNERSKTKPVFLSGDWNAMPRSLTLEKLREFLTILTSQNSRTFHGYKSDARLGAYCIDYIAVDTPHADRINVKETHVTENRVASDHNPLVVTVEFLPPPPPAPPVIVIPDRPTEVERFAAEELAGELGKCLGAAPKILGESRFYNPPALYVGATCVSRALRGERPWRTDEVLLESIHGGVVIDGEPKRAPIAKGNLMVWNYVTDFHNYMLPHPGLTLLAPDIRLFAEKGYYGCTLMDGATRDLSMRSTALGSVSSATGGKRELSFEENATIKVSLGTKRFEDSRILSWMEDTKPANIDTVKFVRADADRRYSLVVKDDGLYANVGLTVSIH